MLGVGVVLSLGVSGMVRMGENKEICKHATDCARDAAENLHVTVLRSMEVLYSIAALHAAHGEINRVDFHDFVQSALARQPELQALSWNPVIHPADRAEAEGRARWEGLSNYQIRETAPQGGFLPAGLRPEYVPVYYIEPLSNNVAALGFDLESDPARGASLARACAQAEPMATAPIRLAQGPDNQTGFLVVLPVYHGSTLPAPAERHHQLAGYAVAVFRVANLVTGSFDRLTKQGLEAGLYDPSPESPL
ncbi:MAG TPA: CHASE domain-containing protein, partial [Verrucomicrobiae bacterium]